MTKPTSPAFWIRIAFLFLYRSGRSTIALSLMLVADGIIEIRDGTIVKENR